MSRAGEKFIGVAAIAAGVGIVVATAVGMTLPSTPLGSHPVHRGRVAHLFLDCGPATSHLMSWQLNEQEFESVLALPAKNRYEYFVKRSASHGELGGLHGVRGWVMAEDDEGKMHFPGVAASAIRTVLLLRALGG